MYPWQKFMPHSYQVLLETFENTSAFKNLVMFLVLETITLGPCMEAPPPEGLCSDV